MSLFQSSPVLCIGGAHIDRLGRTYGAPMLGTSNPGRVAWERGGVARNVAENLARLGCQVSLLSRVGKDENGSNILDHAASIGIDTTLIGLSDECATGSYTAIIGDDGQMVIAVADTEIYREITPETLESLLPRLRLFPNWFVDSDISIPCLQTLLTGAGSSRLCMGVLPTANMECIRPLLSQFGCLFASMRDGAILAELDQESVQPEQVSQRLQDLGCRAGVLTATHGQIAVWSEGALSTLPVLTTRGHSMRGAGCSLAAGTIYGLLRGFSLTAAVQWGLAASPGDVESSNTVSNLMSFGITESRVRRAGLI